MANTLRGARPSSRSARPSCHNRRPCNHRPRRRPACNRRSRRWINNLSLLPRQRHNPPRRRSSRRRSRRNNRLRSRLRHRSRTSHRRRRNHRSRPWRRTARQRLSLLALKNCLQSVARLRYMREVELRLRLHLRLARRAATAAPVLKVSAHLLGLIGLDGTGVGLYLSHANCRQSVQNGSALDFQLPREIVDSNFAHPSPFLFPCAVSCSYQPHRSRNLVQLYYP